MSNRVVAKGNIVDINIMEGYFDQQFKPDTDHDPSKWWEVTDRTTGEVISSDSWQYDINSGTVRIGGAKKWHEYTVSFLAWQIWDSTQMYNHITNNWGDKPHEIPYDPIHPETRSHILKCLDKWLVEHPQTDVVRFTTFFLPFYFML
jgi:Lacto-N-biose phosphorylase.